jgi:hypothetical protein
MSLVNRMWIGDVPLQLKVLTLPERILVARFFKFPLFGGLAKTSHEERCILWFFEIHTLTFMPTIVQTTPEDGAGPSTCGMDGEPDAEDWNELNADLPMLDISETETVADVQGCNSSLH